MQVNNHQNVICVIWILGLFSNTDCYRFEPNTFIYNNHSECLRNEKKSVQANYNVVQVSRNKFDMSGSVNFNENLGGQLDLQIIAERCDFNLSHCELFDTFNIRDICRLMDLKDQLWSDFMKQTKDLRCPFKKSTINITHGIIDLGYVAHLPLNGYTWIFTFKVFHSPPKVRNKKRLVFCISFQITITRARSEQKRTNKSRTTKPK